MKKTTFEEARTKIRSILGLEEAPAAADTSAPMELKEYATDNGVTVMIDRLEAGGKVTNQDGTPVAGDITLVDGTIVSINGEGTITNVTAPVPVEAEAVPAPPTVAPQFSEEFAAKFEAQHQSFAALLAEEKEARQKDAAKFTDAIGQMLSLIQKFADEPSADPVQAPQTGEGAPSKKERATALLNAARLSATVKANA